MPEFSARQIAMFQGLNGRPPGAADAVPDGPSVPGAVDPAGDLSRAAIEEKYIPLEHDRAFCCPEDRKKEMEINGELDWCFLCRYEPPPGENADSSWKDGIIALGSRFYGHLEDKVWAENIQMQYNDELREHVTLNRLGKRPWWGLETIHAHFLKHDRRREIACQRSKKTLAAMMFLLEKGGVCKEDSNGNPKLDFPAAKLWLTLNTQYMKTFDEKRG